MNFWGACKYFCVSCGRNLRFRVNSQITLLANTYGELVVVIRAHRLHPATCTHVPYHPITSRSAAIARSRWPAAARWRA